MNRWAKLLAVAPPTLQRLIARRQRISLPRGCTAEERHTRLRAALCHARTVRAIYFGLSPDAQAALLQLRACPRGLSPDELAARFGPLRPWSHIAADPRPQSLSEQLVLLGVLLPCPATHRHPTRFLLPPEVRASLPRPLNLPEHGPAPAAPPPPALRAACTILIVAAERPLPVRADGRLRRESLRRLAARLALPQAEAFALCQFVWPLLTDLGMLAPHQAAAALAPAGQRFLARSARDQLAQLRAAWVRAPRPEGWLRDLGVTLRGIDWPLLRRRLLAWAAALPSERLLDPASLHAALADALGPLADAQTHGFRCCPPDRTPWQPKSAGLVWDAALRGPLAWLGAVAWTTDDPPPTAEDGGWRMEDGRSDSTPHPFILSSCHLVTLSSHRWVFCPPTDADDLPLLESVAESWRYGELGEVQVPHTTLNSAVLALLPFARFTAATATHLTYRVTGRSLAEAAQAGHSTSVLRHLLTQHAGPIAAGWDALLDDAIPAVQVVHAAVVTSSDPAVLARAATARSVRRYLGARLAPGIALVEPQRATGLVRALRRQRLTVAVQGDPRLAPPAELTPAESATLLAVCAHYRELVPPEMLPPSVGALEDRLRAALPRALAAAEVGSLRPRLATMPGVPCQRAGRSAAWPIIAVPQQTDLVAPPPAQEDMSPLSPIAAPSRQPIVPDGHLATVVSALWALLLLLSRCVPGRSDGANDAVSSGDETSRISTPDAPPVAEEQGADMAAPPPRRIPDPAAYLPPLRAAIAHQRLVRIRYTPPSKPPSERTIRPLYLESHADCWYLHAYCTQAQAERLFRLDRIDDLAPVGRRSARPAPSRPAVPAPGHSRRPARHPAVADTGFFPPPPPPPPGSPLVRVWLVDDPTHSPAAPAQSSRMDAP